MKSVLLMVAVFLTGCRPDSVVPETDSSSVVDSGLEIAELSIERIDGNPHAVWLNSTLLEDARIRVEYSQEGEASLVTAWSSEALDHRLPILGLRGGTDTWARVHVETPSGYRVSEAIEFLTDPAALFMNPQVSGERVESDPSGLLFLMDESDRSTSEAADSPTRFVGVDYQGRLIWDLTTEGFSIANAPFVDVLSEELFFYRTATGGVGISPTHDVLLEFDVGEAVHHDAERLPNGNWVVLMRTTELVSTEGWGEITVVGDALVEIDSDGTTVWRWEVRDHLDWESTVTPQGEPLSGLNFSDWTHANSVQYVEEKDAFLVSFRNLHCVVLVARSSGEILWRAGRSGDFQITNGRWFSGQHDVQLIGEDELLLYDNGLQGNIDESRGVRYRLDFERQEIEQLEEWSAGVLARTMGSISQLENGNIILSSGGHRLGSNPSRVLEYGENGQEVWRLEQALKEQLNYRTTPFRYAWPLE